MADNVDPNNVDDLPDAWKPRFVRADIGAIANDLADARNERQRLADLVKDAQAVEDQYEAELFEALERLGVRSFRTERGLFSMNDLAWSSVEDEQLARSWAETHMPELLLLNRQRLSKVVRDALSEGNPLPPGVTFTTSRKITWRRQ